MDKYEKFQLAEKTPPKQNLKIEFQTNSQTYTHGTDFVLENDFIWFRDRNEIDQEWKALYFDGFPKRKPRAIQADGANFIVIDDLNHLHYKKIAKTKLQVFEIEALDSKPSQEQEAAVQNEKNGYVIHRGFIWVRYFSEIDPVKWYPFHFEGWPYKTPNKLQLEGEKLTIFCGEENVYAENVSKKSLSIKLHGQKFPYENHYLPSSIDTVAEDNWQGWFSLPVISVPFNLLKGNKLKIPHDTVDYAISNRGSASAFITDSAGAQHRVAIEVTTFFLRREGQNFISFSDPWLLPNHFEEHNTSSKIYNKIIKKMIGFEINVPTNFRIDKFCASASTLFIHGKNTKNGNDELYVRLVDYDTEGVNPFLKYGDDEQIANLEEKEEIDRDIRFLPHDYKDLSPDQLWTFIPLDGLEVNNVDFKQMNIIQTGMGNQARDLSIAGSNEAGEKGYYKKSLSEINVPWNFIPFSELSTLT